MNTLMERQRSREVRLTILLTNRELGHPHSDVGGDQDAYRKRAHHDWKFWTALVLMLTAMGVYISTLDLAVMPGVKTPQQVQPALPRGMKTIDATRS